VTEPGVAVIQPPVVFPLQFWE